MNFELGLVTPQNILRVDTRVIAAKLPTVRSSDVLDLLQSEADRSSGEHEAARDYRKRCIKCLCEAAKRYQILPPSLFVHHIEREDTQWPLRGGGFADIWKGKAKDDGRPLCLKVLRMFGESDQGSRKKKLAEFCHEGLLWKQLKHANILPFLGVNTELFAPALCLVLPWMEKGDILTYLKHHPTHDKLKSLREIATGMEYLHAHEPTVVHGDIRGANILVTDDLTCVVADFGLSIAVESDALPTSSGSGIRGSIRWLAPEAISGDREGRARPARDVYAFGCTVLEILTLRPPFSNQSTDAGVILAVVSGGRPQRPQNCPEELWNLIQHCWAHLPQARPKAEDIVTRLQELSISAFNFPLTPTPAPVPIPLPVREHLVAQDLLELGSTFHEDLTLSPWHSRDRDLSADGFAVEPVSSLPTEPFLLPGMIPSTHSRMTTPTPEVRTRIQPPLDTFTPEARLKELWSTPPRCRQADTTGHSSDSTKAKRTLGSDILNISSRKRSKASRGCGNGIDGGERAMPVTGGPSTRSRARRRLNENENVVENVGRASLAPGHEEAKEWNEVQEALFRRYYWIERHKRCRHLNSNDHIPRASTANNVLFRLYYARSTTLMTYCDTIRPPLIDGSSLLDMEHRMPSSSRSSGHEEHSSGCLMPMKGARLVSVAFDYTLNPSDDGSNSSTPCASLGEAEVRAKCVFRVNEKPRVHSGATIPVQAPSPI
ncbi:hypothetical protein V5O48_004221 [Marasmius crinis-equi]|uniref:Protein kinase domain-containing protein n=1 Tax=Marasmius crinis-equi TaxID=585013 RepID=A0ABR3FQN6_9AGAR